MPWSEFQRAVLCAAPLGSCDGRTATSPLYRCPAVDGPGRGQGRGGGQTRLSGAVHPGDGDPRPRRDAGHGVGNRLSARPAQGCSGFLVECGNGATFIFDAGPGTNTTFNTLRIPYWKATRFFITHFHLDHITDLPVYYDFGQMNGRLEPMHIHGPTGGRADESAEAIVDAVSLNPPR